MKKSIFIATTLVASALSLASGISQAQAGTLVPQLEGEIQLTNLACLSDSNPICIDTNVGTKGYTVTSLDYDPKFSLSRLLVDDRASANNYSGFGIKFLADDEGTNPAVLQKYWLRPVAYTAVEKKLAPTTSTVTVKTAAAAPLGAKTGKVDTTIPTPSSTTIDQNGVKTVEKYTVVQTTKTYKQGSILVQDITTKTTTNATTYTPKVAEEGRLEVGKFQFDFTNPLAGLEFKFFDVEDSNYTGILEYTNSQGVTQSINQLLTGGQNGNIQSLVLKDVKSFIVQLGNPGKKYGYTDSGFGQTGDGVDLQLKSVPEPGTTASLGFLTVVSVFGLRQRKKASHLA